MAKKDKDEEKTGKKTVTVVTEKEIEVQREKHVTVKTKYTAKPKEGSDSSSHATNSAPTESKPVPSSSESSDSASSEEVKSAAEEASSETSSESNTSSETTSDGSGEETSGDSSEESTEAPSEEGSGEESSEDSGEGSSENNPESSEGGEENPESSEGGEENPESGEGGEGESGENPDGQPDDGINPDDPNQQDDSLKDNMPEGENDLPNGENPEDGNGNPNGDGLDNPNDGLDNKEGLDNPNDGMDNQNGLNNQNSMNQGSSNQQDVNNINDRIAQGRSEQQSHGMPNEDGDSQNGNNQNEDQSQSDNKNSNGKDKDGKKDDNGSDSDSDSDSDESGEDDDEKKKDKDDSSLSEKKDTLLLRIKLALIGIAILIAILVIVIIIVVIFAVFYHFFGSAYEDSDGNYYTENGNGEREYFDVDDDGETQYYREGENGDRIYYVPSDGDSGEAGSEPSTNTDWRNDEKLHLTEIETSVVKSFEKGGYFQNNTQGFTVAGNYLVVVDLISDDNANIVVLKKDTMEVVSTKAVNMGHANDLAYDKNTGYVIGYGNKTVDGKAQGIKFKLGSDGKLGNAEYFDVPTAYSGIAYDNENNRYILQVGSEIRVYNKELSLVNSFNVPTPMTRQGIGYYNGYIYYACFESGAATEYQSIYNEGEKGSNVIYIYNAIGKFIKALYIPNSKISGELESISFSDSGEMYMNYNYNGVSIVKSTSSSIFPSKSTSNSSNNNGGSSGNNSGSSSGNNGGSSSGNNNGGSSGNNNGSSGSGNSSQDTNKYNDVVFIGDSRTLTMGTESPYDYYKFGVVNNSSISATWGGQLIDQSALENAANAAAKHKRKAVFWYGINDAQMNSKRDDESVFIDNYIKVIDKYMSNNSSSDIYIVSVLTTTPDEKDYYANQNENIRKYNEALKTLCKDRGYHYIDATSLISESNCPNYSCYADDIHFSKTWYQNSYLPLINRELGI